MFARQTGCSIKAGEQANDSKNSPVSNVTRFVPTLFLFRSHENPVSGPLFAIVTLERVPLTL